MNEKLDSILNIFYNEQTLHWNALRISDIIAFGAERFNLKLSSAEVDLALEILILDGYIAESPVQTGQGKWFSLTPSGVQLKQLGGFVKKLKIEKRKQRLVDLGTFAVIIAGVYYLIEIGKFIFKVFQ